MTATLTQKISISLSKSLYNFVDDYQKEVHCKSRSEVINKALYLLQQKHLESCYKKASKELDDSFNETLFDGLENETW